MTHMRVPAWESLEAGAGQANSSRNGRTLSARERKIEGGEGEREWQQGHGFRFAISMNFEQGI